MAPEERHEMIAHVIMENTKTSAIITDERAESSCGNPVLVIDNTAYAPADRLPDGKRAGDCIVLLDLRKAHDDIEGAGKLHKKWMALCDQMLSTSGAAYTIIASKRGTSLSLVIPHEIVDQHSINTGDPYRVEASMDTGKLVITYAKLS